ncbi:DUF6882 domain-containing protein [Corynebacterium sp. H130]|uniref:DUF6882 domain-containing protein n=1 Tax=Corynebacterium sp. H130 TaxID=3133444 RepID=UPI00309B1D81
MLSSPTSVSDVAQDGLIRRKWVDSQLADLFRDITATEVAHIDGDRFEVRHGRRQGPDLTFPATRVARVTGEGWEWTSESMREAAGLFGIAELWGTHPEQPDFEAAVRTLHDGAPVLRALDSILVVHIPVAAGNALLGAAGTGGRALEGYCAMNGAPDIIVRDDVLYDLPTGMLLDDIRSDSHFLSAEHQLFFEALVPAQPGVLGDGVAMFQTPRGPLTARATVMATITTDTWTWNPGLMAIRQFGLANQLPALCTPTLPVELARKWNLERVMKPVLNIWTHTFIPFSADAYALVYLQHPALQLPPSTPEVLSHVLDSPLEAELNRERALGFYCAARGLRRTDLPQN